MRRGSVEARAVQAGSEVSLRLVALLLELLNLFGELLQCLFVVGFDLAFLFDSAGGFLSEMSLGRS